MRVAGLVAAAACVHAGPAPACHLPPLARLLRLDCRLADESAVALTFDDGPDPQGTPAVLEALREARAPATFFLVGEQVARDPALAAEVAAAGHAVGLHCHRHRNQLRLGPSALADDLERGAAVIVEATGAPPRLHRPPYGIYSAYGLALARRRGLRPLLWSRWSGDWRRRATPQSIVSLAADRLRGGDVLLLHDADRYSAPASWQRTAEALPRLLEQLAAQGLRPVAVA